jgi:hypothetical protein
MKPTSCKIRGCTTLSPQLGPKHDTNYRFRLEKSHGVGVFYQKFLAKSLILYLTLQKA